MNQSSLKEGKNVSGIELIKVFDFFFSFFFGQKEDSKSFKITLRTGAYKTLKLLICFLIISVGSNRFFFYRIILYASWGMITDFPVGMQV